MRRFVVILLCVLYVAPMNGCGKKSKDTQPGAAGHAEELADSTRLDSATASEAYDTSSR